MLPRLIFITHPEVDVDRQKAITEWGLSENKRRAKYYRLTPKGRRHLTGAAAAWRQYAKAVFKVLDHT